MLNPIIELLDQDLHIAIQAIILSEQLLLESVQQRWIESLNSLMVNNQNASELIIDYASAFIGSNRDITEFKRTDFLTVLVEHVLLNVVEVEENAQVATLHLQNNLID